LTAGGDPSVVSIVSRPPEAVPLVPSHRSAIVRHGGDAPTYTYLSPCGVLLPSHGFRVPAPVPAPDRALALDALRLIRLLRDPRPRPGQWLEADFAHDVRAVRAHLAPLRSRAGVSASFRREAFHGVPRDPHGDDAPRAVRELANPVRVAYAIRWLEVGDGVDRPNWPDLLTQGV